jgi:copper chaperone CopZ
MKNINFKLDGLTCEACVKLASKRFHKVPGITKVDIDLVSGETRIESEADIEPGILQDSLAGTPYKIVK